MEDHKFKLFENKVLRKIFEHEKHGVSEQFRILYTEKLIVI